MNKFGDKIKVEHTSFINEEGSGTMYTAYYPLIEVYGQFVYILNKDYPTDKINADTRYKARKLGEEFLKRATEKYRKSNSE